MEIHATFQKIAVWISLISLLTVAGLLTYATDPGFKPTAHSAEYYWAQAVLYSLPAKEADYRLPPRYFALAIRRSSTSSSLYVALGDFLRGPIPVAEAFERFTGNDAQSVKIVKNPETLDEVVEQIQSVWNADDQCQAAYLAAVRTEPKSALAHFRLAVYGDDESQSRSAKWLTDHDSSNALGPYLEAAHLLKSNPDAIVPLVQNGNQRARLFFYDDPVPKSRGNRFPGSYDGFAGRPVPDSALEFLVKVQNSCLEFADPLHKSLESLRDQLMVIARAHEHPESDAAVVAQRAFCHKLVFNDSANLSLSMRGLFELQKSYELVCKKLDADSLEFDQATAEHEQMSQFLALLRLTLLPQLEAIEKTPVNAILNGDVNCVKEKLRLVREIQQAARNQSSK